MASSSTWARSSTPPGTGSGSSSATGPGSTRCRNSSARCAAGVRRDDRSSDGWGTDGWGTDDIAPMVTDAARTIPT